MPSERAVSNSTWLRGVGSSGGRPTPPSTWMEVPAVAGSSARIAASTRAASPAVRVRTSTTARLSGATTFGRRPPSMVPTLTVTPSAGSFMANSA